MIEIHPGTYSYQGLLPWSSHQSFIIAPSAFTPTKIFRRSLIGTELMHALDIPGKGIESFSSKEIKAIIEDFSFLPIKCVSNVIDGILHVHNHSGVVAHSSSGSIAEDIPVNDVIQPRDCDN